MSHAGALCAAFLVTASVLAAAPSARFQLYGGLSGKLRAVLLDDGDLRELRAAGAELKEPGVYPFLWPALAPNAPLGQLSVILRTPFASKVGGRIGSYQIGVWPNEDEKRSKTAADRFALGVAAYALPRGFIKVDSASSGVRVSEHFALGDFLSKGQADVWPKYLVLDLRLVDKLELTIKELAALGHPVKRLRVMSGFRTPSYNALEVGPGSRSAISRHMYGDAADVFPDDNNDGWTDDLDRSGRVDIADARILARAVENVEKKTPSLVGGVGIYHGTSAHGPFVHVDVRGRPARWGER